MEDDKKKWIKEGMSVSHRDNLSLKMRVVKFVKQSIETKDGDSKVYIRGVKCHWFDNNNNLNNGVFHTTELVPYDIAVKGIESVNEWTNNLYLLKE